MTEETLAFGKQMHSLFWAVQINIYVEEFLRIFVNKYSVNQGFIEKKGEC